MIVAISVAIQLRLYSQRVGTRQGRLTPFLVSQAGAQEEAGCDVSAAPASGSIGGTSNASTEEEATAEKGQEHEELELAGVCHTKHHVGEDLRRLHNQLFSKDKTAQR